MSKLNDLLAERASVWEEMKTRLEDDSAEGRQAYDRAETRFEELSGDIEKQERHEARSKALAAPDRRGLATDATTTVPEDDAPDDLGAAYRDAFTEYVTRGMGELDTDQRKALRRGFQPAESRAQGIGTSSAGGYLVPQGFRQQITETMKDYGAVMDVAQVIDTTTGASLPWPTNDDTGNVGALLAENTQATEQDLTLGVKTLGAYKYTSKIVRVSLEFLQDVDWLNAEDFLRRKFAERLGRIHNQHFTTGTGSSQPQGIVTGATSGVTAAGVAAITADELIDLQHSVDPAYRRSPRAAYMLSDTALKSIRKLKDLNGLYLYQPSAQQGVPSTINGAPYVINVDMAVPATGVKSVLFGDFYAGYVIRMVREFALIRLDERYADYGQVGFIGFDRADGLVQDAAAYKALTQA